MTQKIIYVASVCLDKFCLRIYVWRDLTFGAPCCTTQINVDFCQKSNPTEHFFHLTFSDLSKLGQKSSKFDFHLSKINLPTYFSSFDETLFFDGPWVLSTHI
jgi:hypothetical protein